MHASLLLYLQSWYPCVVWYDCLKQPVRNLAKIMGITTEVQSSVQLDGVHTCGNYYQLHIKVQLG